MTAPNALEAAVLREIVDWALKLAQTRPMPIFTAAILKDGSELCRAQNRVAETCDPTRHAEIEAMARAGALLETPDLEGCTLIASCQPCEMCLAAMRWAGIGRVVFAATQANIGPAYFQFPRLGIADLCAASGDAFSYHGGQEEHRALPLYSGRHGPGST
ncbi:nucleoside deaminase [Lutimaribacter sp. EGI FJ00015]|uniref:Nucleoside deaminase n=1 Tax=Lutimaribacter degradans TaxID=2945989 RepID=A0ACC5ZX23_9RHOB|nr:nucleoside deaminase [Lutimaribacter sp. EGI FJ00013]MCM2562621.1 nucleoside deaminase [Lutimaribacter sp. EGI FJ00013]MCO0613778.1 nucleoside deaminase [Lutimaribacter sp. EGI FJ00015]MCO0636739.1 nucleoside deaminase [Lutimaribacter sp. EGI FJ00014]